MRSLEKRSRQDQSGQPARASLDAPRATTVVQAPVALAPPSSVGARRPIRARATHSGTVLALASVVVLLALRLPHLRGPLDDPHSWRQCDTVFYSLDLCRRGMDILHPAVSWLGAHRTLIFELPLPEALTAMLYRVFGPDPLWDRVVALAGYLLATFYLWRIARHVGGARVGWLALISYLALPLAQFYSRAPQVDFAATAGAHAFLYHTIRAIERRSWPHASGAAIGGTLCTLLKAPYLIPMLPALAPVALSALTFSTVALGAVALGIPAVAFALWRRHVDAVNAAAPEWNFLPGYYKEVNPLWWYFGTTAQRLDPANWMKIARRLVFEVVTPLGVVLGAIAAWPGWRRARMRWIAWLWTAGALAYAALFFNLNVIHSYYQIPFLAPAALLVALGVDTLWGRKAGGRRALAAQIGFAAFLVVAATAPARLGYYRVDWLRVEAGRQIEARVPRGEMVVACDYGAGYSDPRLLVRANREGWSLAIPDLEPGRVRKLADLGARWVAVVTDPAHPALVPPSFLNGARVAQEPITHDRHALGTLSIYDLWKLAP